MSSNSGISSSYEPRPEVGFAAKVSKLMKEKSPRVGNCVGFTHMDTYKPPLK